MHWFLQVFNILLNNKSKEKQDVAKKTKTNDQGQFTVKKPTNQHYCLAFGCDGSLKM